MIDCQNKIASVTKSKLSALTLNSIEMSRKANIRAVVMAVFSAVKVCYQSKLQTQVVFLPVTSKGKRAISKKSVRRGSHRGGSLQNRLGDERTCGMTLASAYVLHRLSATWL